MCATSQVAVQPLQGLRRIGALRLLLGRLGGVDESQRAGVLRVDRGAGSDSGGSGSVSGSNACWSSWPPGRSSVRMPASFFRVAGHRGTRSAIVRRVRRAGRRAARGGDGAAWSADRDGPGRLQGDLSLGQLRLGRGYGVLQRRRPRVPRGRRRAEGLVSVADVARPHGPSRWSFRGKVSAPREGASAGAASDTGSISKRREASAGNRLVTVVVVPLVT